MSVQNSAREIRSHGPSTELSSARHIYLYRRLETEVHRVLYLQEDVGLLRDRGMHPWLHDITSRLESWHENAKVYSQHQMLEFRDVQYAHLRAKIHRPTPRLPVRSNEDRLICLDMCQILVEDYQRQVRAKRLFYPWHAVHILFEAGVIMLDACWSLRDVEASRRRSKDALFVYIPICLEALAKVGETWHAANICSTYIRRTADEVENAVNDPLPSDSVMIRAEREDAICKILTGLLFPEGPITWESYEPGKSFVDDIHDLKSPLDKPFFDSFDSFDWDVL